MMKGRFEILDKGAPGLGTNDEHPSIETLDSYRQEVLYPDETTRIRRHLVLCRECSETLLDLVQFLEESPEPSRLWSAELTAAWEEWQAALKQREAVESPVSQEDLEPAIR